MKTIKLSNTGKDVRYLQELLLQNGYKQEINGTFDEATRENVILFQSKHNLDTDGIVGIVCWDALTFSNRPAQEKITEEDIILAANMLDVEPACLKAVLKIETGGRGGFLAPGKPAILFEAHHFWRELKNVGIDPVPLQKEHPNILSPTWNQKLYKGGIKEYDRLNEAMKIHEAAALMSISSGIGQIMGSNHKLCGEKSVIVFMEKEKKSEQNQLRHFIIFLHKSKLAQFLIDKDWANFAKGYNGPSYEKHQYHLKLKSAYEELTKQK
ncbi:N-acetylmuramidase domain-containing protein [Parabacteroides chinchillae]